MLTERSLLVEDRQSAPGAPGKNFPCRGEANYPATHDDDIELGHSRTFRYLPQ
jgi:hypothetical protein